MPMLVGTLERASWIAGTGLVFNGNGRVSDIHGWDTVPNDASVYHGGTSAAQA
jgi:hypothetical protein